MVLAVGPFTYRLRLDTGEPAPCRRLRLGNRTVESPRQERFVRCIRKLQQIKTL